MSSIIWKLNAYAHVLYYYGKNMGVSEAGYRIKHKLFYSKRKKPVDYTAWRRSHIKDVTLENVNEINRDGISYFVRPSFGIVFADMDDNADKKEIAAYPFVKSLRNGMLKDYRIVKLPKTADKTELIKAVKSVKEDYLFFARKDDFLHRSAIAALSNLVSGSSEAPDAIYTDEDSFEEVKGEQVFSEPYMKPDYASYYQESTNYIRRMTVVSKKLMLELLESFADGEELPECVSNGVDEMNPEFIFRVLERAKRVGHLDMPVYSARKGGNEPVTDAQIYIKYVREHFDRIGREGKVSLANEGTGRATVKISYPVKGEPLVSVIIPNKDHAEDLKRAVNSVAAGSYKNLEFIIVENNSELDETEEAYKELLARDDIDVKLLRYEKTGFNYSAINNMAIKEARGEYILLLNNDIEMVNPDAIREMLGYAQRPDVGMVGARLYFEDKTIQHAGVVIGIGGLADHLLRGLDETDEIVKLYTGVSREYSAVTAACAMISRELFNEIGGFDESIEVAFNDVDLCMKVTEKGKKIIYVAQAILNHYESKSRGQDDTLKKQKRFFAEVKKFSDRWHDRMMARDRYYNRNLTLVRTDASLKE